jgi:CheY-like chemotaxis protein
VIESQVEILLVEDNDADAELTERALKGKHLSNRLRRARDGQEALDFLFAVGRFAGRRVEDAPKLVLLDLKLPKVDGLEVLRRLKSDARTKEIPIVVMTSSREDQDLIRSYGLGVNGYVVKPVEFESFSKTVAVLGFYWLLLNQLPLQRTVPRVDIDEPFERVSSHASTWHSNPACGAD